MTLTSPCLLFIGDATSEDSIELGLNIAHEQPEFCLAEYATANCTVTTQTPRMDIWQAAERGVKYFLLAKKEPSPQLMAKWLPVLIEALEAGLDILHNNNLSGEQLAELQQHAKRLNRQIIKLH